MLLLKLLAICVTTGSALLQIGLEYKWRDRRTKKHTLVKQGLVALIIAGAIAACILVALDDRQSTAQIDKLTALKKTAEVAASDAAAREEVAKKDREELKQKMDELQMRIDPFLTIATARYPNLNPDKALELLADEVKQLRQRTDQLDARTQQLATRDIFHPLSSELKLVVVHRLKQIQIRFPQRKISVSVYSDTGHTGRQKVAEELVAVLREGGVDASGPQSGMTFSRRVLPAVTVDLNPSDEDIARALSEALNPFLRVKFSGRKKEAIEVGRINIGLHGEPLFADNGVVSFP